MELGNVSASTRGDLTIFKYTQDCHIESRWNNINRMARGLIMKNDGTIVARPFCKFFNLNEVTETQGDNLPWHENVEIFEKLDGSCAIFYKYNGRWCAATPGSLESEQAQYAEKIAYNEQLKYIDSLNCLPEEVTPIFEVIYPANKIVVSYGDEEFLCLLGIMEHSGKEWHQSRVDLFALENNIRRPKRYNIDLRSDIPFNDNEEGYVFRFASGLRVKVKSPTYLRIHRLLNYMSPKGVIELIRGHEYGTTVKQLPQAIACDFDDIRAYVQSQYDCLKNKVQDYFGQLIAQKLTVRKDIALWIQANVPNELTGLVFATLDGKSIEDQIWRLVAEKVKDEKTKTE